MAVLGNPLDHDVAWERDIKRLAAGLSRFQAKRTAAE